jgi:thiazole synthase ThiGH ThiG subunit
VRDVVAEEARRRIDEAASLVRSAIRLGGDPEYVAKAMRTAVAWGAEQYAEDTMEAFEASA